jgi:hypothetical protein
MTGRPPKTHNDAGTDAHNDVGTQASNAASGARLIAQMSELNDLILQAVENRDYEQVARLDGIRQFLLTNLNNLQPEERDAQLFHLIEQSAAKNSAAVARMTVQMDETCRRFGRHLRVLSGYRR